MMNPYSVLKKIKNKLSRIKQSFLERRWAAQDSLAIRHDEKVLFVDLGANLGQGYFWFKKYFNGPNISFELFEPNPYCVEKLEKLDDVVVGKVKLHPAGVGVTDGLFDFFGLGVGEGGKYSQGGSLLETHNSNSYVASKDKSMKVKVIDFASYLESKSAEFDKIIVKMDIEGAEVELLEVLLKQKKQNSCRFCMWNFIPSTNQWSILSTRSREKKSRALLRRQIQRYVFGTEDNGCSVLTGACLFNSLLNESLVQNYKNSSSWLKIGRF